MIMTISSYLKNKDFDNYRLFFRKNKSFETYVLDKGDRSELVSFADEKILPNEILNVAGQINPTFVEVVSSKQIDRLKRIINSETIRIYPNRKYSEFDAAIILEKENEIVGGINLDLKNRLARTIKNEILAVSHEEIEFLFELFNELNYKITDHYLPPSLVTYSYWMNYRFPFDFFYNAAFEVYETTLNTGLMCTNFVHSRLEINPVNGQVTKEQILRVQSLEWQRHHLNEKLKDKFWELYQTQKNDYELPELNNKDQLPFLVKTQSISIPSNENEPISIHFETWDKEHGQTVYYTKENELEFE